MCDTKPVEAMMMPATKEMLTSEHVIDAQHFFSDR